MEKLLSANNIRKEPDRYWQPQAWGGLISLVLAMELHISYPPDTELLSFLILGVLSLLCAAATASFCWFRLTTRLGLCPSIYHSTFLRPIVKDRVIRFQLVPGVYLAFFAGGFSFASVVVTCFLCKLEQSGNVVPMFLLLLSPVLTSLSAYIICKESLQFFQILGVVTETLGLVTITLSLGGVWDWTSLVLGAIGLTALTSRTVLVKITEEVRFDNVSETITELIVIGLLGTAAGMYGYYNDNMRLDMSLWEAAVRLIETLAWILTIYFLNSSLYNGPAALIQGFSCLSILLVVPSDYRLWTSSLISGMALSTLGVLCFLILDRMVSHTSFGRTLHRPKKPQSHRDSNGSAAYIRLIDR